MSPTRFDFLRQIVLDISVLRHTVPKTVLSGLFIALAACRDGESPQPPPLVELSTGASTGRSSRPARSSRWGPIAKRPSPLPTKRLAEGLLPPTNRWFSGLVFGDQPQPVFPLPLSFGLTAGGFSFGLPTVTASEKAILGGFKPDVAVQTGAKSTQVSAYDSLTVTIDNLDGAGKVLGEDHAGAGLALRRYTAEAAGEMTTKLPLTKTALDRLREPSLDGKAGETSTVSSSPTAPFKVGAMAARSSSTRAARRRGSSCPPTVPPRSWPNWRSTR